MTHNASGRFEVDLTPRTAEESVAVNGVARNALEKRFYGDLEGTGSGEMLVLRTELEDSAAYVALERVTGRLEGRTGTFALQHSATVERGFEQLTISIVPDSGTDELVGIEGRMSVTVFNDEHLYELEYTLPDADEPVE